MEETKPSKQVVEYRGFGSLVKVETDENGLISISFVFDRQEAKGTIVVNETGYGVGMNIEGIPGSVCSIDLFHPAVDDGRPLLIVDNCNNGDPLATVELSPDGAKLSFESGVSVIDYDNISHRAVYGNTCT